MAKLETAILMELPWKEFNVSLPALKAAVNALAPGKCCGITIGHGGVLWVNFDEEISADERQSVLDMWDGVDADSEMAADYKSKEEIKAEADTAKAALKAAAKAKILAAIAGLSSEEADALLE